MAWEVFLAVLLQCVVASLVGVALSAAYHLVFGRSLGLQFGQMVTLCEFHSS